MRRCAVQTYETIFIARPTLTEDEEQSTVEVFQQIVTEGGGSLIDTDRMGRRRLAYPIHKHNDGIYVRVLYDSEAAVPKELERRMRLSDDVLRALTVKLERGWAVHAKEQAVRDAEARVEAARLEKEREAAAAAAAAEAAAAGADAPADGTTEPAATPAADQPEAGTGSSAGAAPEKTE